MKTTPFKLLAATATVLFILLISTAFTHPQASGNRYLTMWTFQSGLGGQSKIVIVYEDGKAEELELQKFRVDNMLPNAVRINQAINNLAGKGYDLVTSTGSELTSLYTFVMK